MTELSEWLPCLFFPLKQKNILGLKLCVCVCVCVCGEGGGHTKDNFPVLAEHDWVQGINFSVKFHKKEHSI